MTPSIIKYYWWQYIWKCMYMLQTSDEWMYSVLKICDSSDEKITQQIIETNKISR